MRTQLSDGKFNAATDMVTIRANLKAEAISDMEYYSRKEVNTVDDLFLQLNAAHRFLKHMKSEYKFVKHLANEFKGGRDRISRTLGMQVSTVGVDEVEQRLLVINAKALSSMLNIIQDLETDKISALEAYEAFEKLILEVSDEMELRLRGYRDVELRKEVVTALCTLVA